MKIETKINNNYKLLKFNIIKNKILKKIHFLKNIKLEDIEIRIKKALYLIYLYHINEKKILFVGNPLKINKELFNLFKKSQHIFIPKNAWISGIITNQYSSLKPIFKKDNNITKISKIILKLKKKSDLIVILDKQVEYIALKESYSSKIPSITLNTDLNPFDVESCYKIPGNFNFSKNISKNNFFYSILIATLKKAEIIKKKFPSIIHKISTINNILKKKFKRNFYKKKNDFKKKK
jgi:ribosomal protein S2